MGTTAPNLVPTQAPYRRRPVPQAVENPRRETSASAAGDGFRNESCPTDLIQSLQRGLRILEFVAAAPGPVAAKEIAAGVELKLATTYHLINTLLHTGYLRRGAGQGLLLGDQSLGSARVAASLEQPQWVPIRRALGRAAYAISDVVLMTVLDGSRATVVASEEVPGAPSSGRYPVGSCHLPHESAAGRMMLSAQEPLQASRLLEQCHALADSWGAAFDAGRVEDELNQAHQCGVSLARTDLDACVGAPVFDREGQLVAAVAIVVPPARLTKDAERLAQVAHATATAISRTVARVQLTGQLDDRLRALTKLVGTA